MKSLSSHATRVQSDCIAAGPGLTDIQEIERLLRGNPEAAPGAEIGRKDHFRIGN
ncbi:hypothetical protein TRIP_B110111 [uncultured Desulfatiglans sp.]|nr:hypothetical protein TRIP_B110111 [uncultured Desulfatiglans sp.]